jgi:hypothetical protein
MKISIAVRRWRMVLPFVIALCAATGCGGGLDSRGTPSPSNASANAPAGKPADIKHSPPGFPYDWSHRHLIFSRPLDASTAQRLQQEPRYQMQQAWRARQGRDGGVDAYMQSLDARARQLAATRTLPVLPRLKWGLPAPHKRGVPLAAWSESESVPVGTPDANASFPAKFMFTSSTSCTDWVVFPVPVAGSAGQFNLFAFKNLYTSTCTGPTLKFAYAVAFVGGPLLTASVLSPLGDQVAFVESQPTATLDVIKFTDVASAPTFPNPNPAAALSTCGTAPCGKTITYDHSAAATLSAPFYDYTTGQDTAYVSDDNSTVWAVSPVFNGSLALKTGWGPGVIVNNANTVKLTAPVYDTASQNVFVGDSLGNLYYVRTQSTSAGTCKGVTTGTPCVGDTPTTLTCTGPGTPSACCTNLKQGCNALKVSSKAIIEPVIVDSSTEKVFVFLTQSEHERIVGCSNECDSLGNECCKYRRWLN